MGKHIIDTDLYVDLIRTGKSHSVIREIYVKEIPGIHFSSVVAQELLSGVQSALGKRLVRTLLEPFERTGRIVTPTHKVWKEAGDILARIFRIHPEFKSKLPGLVNDGLLAASARSIGATLYTRNRDDFQLIHQIRPFSLVILAE
ncbi:type II toxin-antitoxin system VapC family toxin [bacterium]|nr:type II toxin-antitoxin system VapC family toxin [bacterium]